MKTIIVLIVGGVIGWWVHDMAQMGWTLDFFIKLFAHGLGH